MKTGLLVKAVLGVAGVIAAGVGFGVLFVPHGFHATAGIMLGDDANLLNEMRAPGGMVLVSGLFMLAAALRASLAGVGLLLASVLYLSFGLSRGVSVVLDGVPGGAMVQILVLELVIGAACAALLLVQRPQLRS